MSLLKQLLELPYKTIALRHGLDIGKECVILNGWRFGSEPYLITIGNHVRICAGVRFITHDGGMWVLRHKYNELKDADLFGRIVIGNNCHIGTDVTIMPGVRIGNDCIVGCGAVVTKSIPDGSIAAGVPARIICTIEQYRYKNESKILPTKGLSWNSKREYISDIVL